jgi:hypothetical protein
LQSNARPLFYLSTQQNPNKPGSTILSGSLNGLSRHAQHAVSSLPSATPGSTRYTA